MKMFLFLLVLCTTVDTFSQLPIGVKAGITINEMSFRKGQPENTWTVDYGYLPSAHIGFFTKIKISNKFNFLPEFQFIQKWSNLRSLEDKEIKLSYLETPLSISFQPIQWLAVEGGGSVGINIEDNSRLNSYNSVDAGVIGGLRFNVTDRFSILSRYYHGLTPIGTITFGLGSLPDVVYKLYNQNFQFSLAYEFN